MRRRRWYLSSLVAPALFAGPFAATLIGQQAPGGVAVFSAVSIKPSANTHRHHIEFDDQHFVTTNYPLLAIIQFAYGLPYSFQLQGSPEWVGSANYDIDARVEGAGGPSSTPQVQVGAASERPAIEALLRDRFGLVVHTERREVPVLALMVAKGGAKLKAAASSPNSQGGVYDGPTMGILEGRSATLPMLARSLRRYTPASPIFDKTGLAGPYDFTLHWNPAADSSLTIGPAPYQVPNPSQGKSLAEQCERGQVPGGCVLDSMVPSISVALRDELGLELKTTQVWMDTIVVDRIHKPAAN